MLRPEPQVCSLMEGAASRQVTFDQDESLLGVITATEAGDDLALAYSDWLVDFDTRTETKQAREIVCAGQKETE